jgi:membrane protein YqaA with SNARE-associated domain
LTAWIEELATRPYAAVALFVVALIEGAIFPLPPDPLFITLSIANPKRVLRFALVAATGSILGSFIGYAIGLLLFDSVGHAVLAGLGTLDAFKSALSQYAEHGVLSLILSGFTPMPYAVMTIAAGFNHTLPFTTLVIGSVLGRAIRFGILGGLLALFGPRLKRFMEEHRLAMGAMVVAFLLLSVGLLRWFL